MDELLCRRFPRVYEHFVVLTASAVGALAATILSGEWRAAIASSWCFVAIAWFPSAILGLFRRTGTDGFLVSAALLSGIAGFDGFLRLVRQSAAVGC